MTVDPNPVYDEAKNNSAGPVSAQNDNLSAFFGCIQTYTRKVATPGRTPSVTLVDAGANSSFRGKNVATRPSHTRLIGPQDSYQQERKATKRYP